MPVAAPLIGAAAGLAGSAIAAGATGSAARAQAAQQQSALAQQQHQFDVTQQNMAPWLGAGKTALGGQLDLLGLGQDGASGQQASIDQLQQSPLYQSLFRNGQNTILNNAAATGGLRGGNMQSSLANFGSDTLAQVIQQQLANLGGISNTGNQTAQNLGNLSQNNANAQSNQYNAIGSTQAGGILGQAGIWNNAFNGLGKALGGISSSLPTGFWGNVTPSSSLYANAGSTIAANPSIF
jgi:hypothetical protein